MVGTNSTEAVSHSTVLVFGTLNVILCSISSILSLVLILATTIPLLSPTRRKQYSTYNLYLAYLSIPDLAVNVFILYLTITHTRWTWTLNETHDDNSLWFCEYPWDDAVYPLCATANLYINAFVIFEIYKLTKNSSLRKRYYPPTIWEVTKHSMISYGAGMFIFVLDFFIVADRLDNNTWASPTLLRTLHLLYWAVSFAICIVVPLSALIAVSAMIFCQGLIESTRSLYEGRLRVLTLFFLRIVFLDVLVWLPCSISYTIQWLSENPRTEILAYNTSLLFSGIQVMVNFWTALTKPDTRTLIVDLLTLDCCRTGNDREADDKADPAPIDEDGRRRRDPFLRSVRSMSLCLGKMPVSLLQFPQRSSVTQQPQTREFSQRSSATQQSQTREPSRANEETQHADKPNGTTQDLDDKDDKTSNPCDEETEKDSSSAEWEAV